MMVTITLDNARHEVLAENTAQAVYKHLSKLFAEEHRFRKRWVWELLQNARDASPSGGVKVWLIEQPKRMILRHSGLPFSYKSIAHLIYHGSTKYDLTDSGPIGQFGTGFLTTHLISKTVRVKGKTEDGKNFSFLLDRQGNNADQLGTAMEESWKAFTEAMADGTCDIPQGFTTEYEYPLSDEVHEVVKEGLDDLIANAAYVLAFNKQTCSIHLNYSDRSITIEKGATEPLGNGAYILQVKESTSGNDSQLRYVAIITGNNGVSVAVELSETNSCRTVADLGKTPRIFVAFPLTGTRDFCLPVVVNHERFQPREDRDTLVLRSNREGKHPNMDIMEVGFTLAAKLAVLGAEMSWHSAPTLVHLNDMRHCEWVDEEWLRNMMVECVIDPLRSKIIMTTASGGRIAPCNGKIPLASDNAHCSDLWDVAVRVNGDSECLPRREEAGMWSANLVSWSAFLQQPAEDLKESLTLDKICKQVNTWGSIEKVGEHLEHEHNPIEWLRQLHTLISKMQRIDLFEHMRIIPSQSGVLKKITELNLDPGIDEDLKDISESLGLPTRDGLLDSHVISQGFPILQPKPQEEILTGSIQKLKEKIKAADARIGKVAVRLFTWLVRNNEAGRLDGFPVLTRRTTGENCTWATLLSDPAKSDERLLSPIITWPEHARHIADIFPKEKTLSDAYGEVITENEIWVNIEEAGYIRLCPLYMSKRRMPFLPDEPLPESEKEKKLKHRTTELVEVSALAFFEKDETGLDAVRRSQKRAINLLHFLTHFVLEQDSSVLDPQMADCECGERHHYYGAAWLVPMWERRWVPLGDNKQSSATAETIAQLFEGREEELRQLTAGHGRKLLEALNISLADLSLRAIAKDEDTRISLIGSLAEITSAAGNDPEKVKLVAEDIKEFPEFLDQMREYRERREKVQRNQLLGAEVERLLKEALENRGLKVTRTGRGSDFELEEDYVVDGKEVFLEVEDGPHSFLVEIKATTGTTARMTFTQAETAVNNKNRFMLCVVPLGAEAVTPVIVQERSRFVMNIGDQIEPVLKEFHKYQNSKYVACTRMGQIELIVQDSTVRFLVDEGAWLEGITLHETVEQIHKLGNNGDRH